MAEPLATARALARMAPRRARLPDLRRAASTVHDALFPAVPAIAEDAADPLAGLSGAARTTWLRVRRSLEHRRLRDLDATGRELGLSAGALRLGATIRQHQEGRERADCDPTSRCRRKEARRRVERVARAERTSSPLSQAARRQIVLALDRDRGPRGDMLPAQPRPAEPAP